MPLASTQPVLRQAIERPDLLDERSPAGLRVLQLTSDDRVASGHVYMEAPVFTPDSRRFVYHRMWIDEPTRETRFWRREFWLCDLEDNFALRQLTTDHDATAPAVSPDGRWLYYFLNQRRPASRRGIRLQRVDLDTGRDETLLVLDRPLDGHAGPPSLLYPLGTIRSDGQAVACGAFLGDGVSAPRWGVLVCDLTRQQARVVMDSDHLINPHMQYCRSTDPTLRHDLLIQENLGVTCRPDGERIEVASGCRLYVLRDDGTNLRVLPCGDPPHEMVHGHQEWRGQGATVIVGVDHRYPERPHTRPCIEAAPLPVQDRSAAAPSQLPGAAERRHDITRALPGVAFGHTAFDPTGTRFVGDWRHAHQPGVDAELYLGHLPLQPGAPLSVRYLLKPRSSYGRC